MGWIDESGRHEGYVLAMFADGKLGGGMSHAAGLALCGPDGRVVYRDDHSAEPAERRPHAAVIGWRVACDHVPAHVHDDALGGAWGRHETWVSPTLWRRVYSPTEENLDHDLIYAPLQDKYSVDIADRDDLEDFIQAEWRTHIEPEDHARSIRHALNGVTTAKQLLDLEVAAAHSAGLSWADIGRIAGITRQAARDRWGST